MSMEKNIVLIVKLTQNMNLKVIVGFAKNVSKIFYQILIRVLIVMIVMIVSLKSLIYIYMYD